MDAFDQTDTRTHESVEPQDGADAAELWAALRADLRARDERTARLRAMRLIGGDDDTV